MIRNRGAGESAVNVNRRSDGALPAHWKKVPARTVVLRLLERAGEVRSALERSQESAVTGSDARRGEHRSHRATRPDRVSRGDARTTRKPTLSSR